jgi:hypothetical protein
VIGKVLGQIARLRAAVIQVLRISVELEAVGMSNSADGDDSRMRPARQAWRELDAAIIHEKVVETYRARRRRDRFLPAELFGEPAWDLLLDLFAARLHGRLISVTSACYAAGVPPTTALRWLGLLEEQGLVERTKAETDNRVSWIRLSDSALRQMCAYFEDLLASAEFEGWRLLDTDLTVGES